ncbi:MAG: glutamine--fructose-6-phosphate transaminase (isomerizing), partial [Gemmataceae bacterium]
MPPQSRVAEPDNLPKGLDVAVCGIVGYVGHEAALPYLLAGLETLEYRGYDSAGVALVNRAGVTVKKSAGHLKMLKEHVNGMDIGQNCGIGHTRWATHGAPTDENAHPHTDCRGRIAAVHNGIIENYRSLREELRQKGHQFQSETDTEVIPHLLEAYDQGNLVEAARAAARRLEGAYAFLAVSADDQDTLVAVREASPLVIGLGDGVNYVASDFTALLPYTRRILVLDNGELAVVRPDGVRIEDLHGHPVTREPMAITWTTEQASRGGYPHFMIKEIREQPDVWGDCLRGRVSSSGGVILPELGLSNEDLAGIHRIHIVAAGTAYHAGLVGAQLIERLARIPVTVEVASEFRYRDPILDPGTVVWAVSQSGETADTLASVRLAKSRGCPVWAITNVVGSTLSREADRVAYNRAGPEVAVASTKAYTTQLLILSLLTAALASHRGLSAQRLTEQLQLLPGAGSRWLDDT